MIDIHTKRYLDSAKAQIDPETARLVASSALQMFWALYIAYVSVKGVFLALLSAGGAVTGTLLTLVYWFYSQKVRHQKTSYSDMKTVFRIIPTTTYVSTVILLLSLFLYSKTHKELLLLLIYTGWVGIFIGAFLNIYTISGYVINTYTPTHCKKCGMGIEIIKFGNLRCFRCTHCVCGLPADECDCLDSILSMSV